MTTSPVGARLRLLLLLCAGASTMLAASVTNASGPLKLTASDGATLDEFGTAVALFGDTVDGADLALLLASWGACP